MFNLNTIKYIILIIIIPLLIGVVFNQTLWDDKEKVLIITSNYYDEEVQEKIMTLSTELTRYDLIEQSVSFKQTPSDNIRELNQIISKKRIKVAILIVPDREYEDIPAFIEAWQPIIHVIIMSDYDTFSPLDKKAKIIKIINEDTVEKLQIERMMDLMKKTPEVVRDDDKIHVLFFCKNKLESDNYRNIMESLPQKEHLYWIFDRVEDKIDTYTYLRDLYKKDPNTRIDYIISASDEITEGSIYFYDYDARKDISRPKMISLGGSLSAASYIQSGQLDSTFMLDLRAEAKYIDKIMRGRSKDLGEKYIIIPKLITQENVKDVYELYKTISADKVTKK